MARKKSRKRTVRSTKRTSVEDFNPDYTYIKRDLVRIGVLAGTFITILVILSFFLN